jgi:Curlin associated repeat.
MEIPNCAAPHGRNNFAIVSKILLSNQNFIIMKKFGILLVLAMFAIGVNAQEANRHHHPYLKGNDANLTQVGLSQWGFIFQFGDNNEATINQGVICGDLTVNSHGDFSYKNTAFIVQIGNNNDGTINQTGHENLANLWQINFSGHHHQYAELVANDYHPELGTKGVINQSGSHNIVSVLQLGGSNLVINQSGEHNYIGGAYHEINFCDDPEHYSYEQSCNPDFMFMPLIVGKGQTLDLTQTGHGEYFFGIGVLKGTRSIMQGNNLGWDEQGYGHHHSHLDFNVIWLAQEGGNAVLSQNGRYNKIWLDIDVKHHNSPDVTISQTGYKNAVAKFEGPCDHCACGPAEFNGDNMTVTQNGYKNRLSVDSDGMKNDITVTQTGAYNFGMIVQKDIMHHSSFPTCAGCQQ